MPVWLFMYRVIKNIVVSSVNAMAMDLELRDC